MARTVGDCVLAFMRSQDRPVRLTEIYTAVDVAQGRDVPRSSIRQHMNTHVPKRYERVQHGLYRLAPDSIHRTSPGLIDPMGGPDEPDPDLEPLTPETAPEVFIDNDPDE